MECHPFSLVLVCLNLVIGMYFIFFVFGKVLWLFSDTFFEARKLLLNTIKKGPFSLSSSAMSGLS